MPSRLRARDPEDVRRAVDARRWPSTSARCSTLQRRGAITFDYGNNIRAQAQQAGVDDAFDIPGFVPEYIRPLFCEGKGPFRWVALSGDPDDIARDRPRSCSSCSATTRRCAAGSDWRGERVEFQGLPARICWLGYGERARGGPGVQRAGAHAAS